MPTRAHARRSIAPWLVAVLTMPGVVAAETLRVGMAEADITPRLDAGPVWIAGFQPHRRATGIHDPLMARAVVLDDGNRKVALVSVDLIGLGRPTVEQIRSRLPDFFFTTVSSTHTHHGPDTIGLWGATVIHNGVDPKYLARVVDQCVAAVRQAERRLEPVWASYGSVETKGLVADSRLPKVYDDVLRVLSFHRPGDQGLAGLVVQWNCHPEVLGRGNHQLTADFVADAVAALTARYQCPVAYFTGPVGGLMTPPDDHYEDSRGTPIPNETFTYAYYYGLDVDIWASKAVRAARPIELTPIDVVREEIVVPVTNPYYHLAKALGVLDREGIETGKQPGAAGQRLSVRSEVALLRLGQLYVACIPGEIYPELVYGEYPSRPEAGVDFPDAPLEKPLASILPSKRALFLGLAGDELGYIMPKRQWDWNPPYAYGRSKPQYGEINSCGPEVAPIVMGAFERLAAKLDSKREPPITLASARAPDNPPVPPASGTDPHRPPAIETENVPVVPERIYRGLEQYQSMRSAAFLGWSPDGRGMLVATRFGNSNQLHRVYEPGGRREQITFYDEPASGRFIPSATDGAILVSMSQGGSENDQVYLLDRAAFRTVLLTDGKSRNQLGPVRNDGTQMVIHSNRRNGRDTDIYVADCRAPHSERVLLETTNEFWMANDWSQDGRRFLLVHEVSINEGYPALLDVDTGKVRALPLPAEGKAAVGQMAFAPDGQTCYITTDARGEFLELWRLDLKTLKYTSLSHDIAWDVSEIKVEPQSGRVAFTVNADGASQLYLLERDKPRLLPTPLGTIDHLDFSPDGRRLGFTLTQPAAPADAYSLRLDDARLARWTYSETGGLDPESFVRPEQFQFESFDGRKIPAYIFKPRHASREKPAAVLVSIHGGPESQYRPDFSPLVQYFVKELGIAVVHPNVRGSAGYGKTYLKLDNAQLREDSVKDIGALLDWIGRQKDLDARRVAVIGGSYGGYMVLGSLVNFPDRIKAGIDIVGIANFITFLERTSPYRQDLRRAEYGDERKPEMRAFFERINPSGQAEKIRSALLVVHGKNDPRVPFSEAEQIAARVRGSGKKVWTLYAENEGHGFAKKDNRDYLSAVEAWFLERNLLRD